MRESAIAEGEPGLPDFALKGNLCAMVNRVPTALTRRDRAFLQAVLRGQDIAQIAAARQQPGREVLADLRRVLTLLRAGAQPPAADPERTGPQP